MSVLQLLATAPSSTLQRAVASLVCAVAQCSTERAGDRKMDTPILLWPALAPALMSMALCGDAPYVTEVSTQPDQLRRTVALELLGWLLQALGPSLTPQFKEFAQLQDLLVQAVLDSSPAVQSAGLAGLEELAPLLTSGQHVQCMASGMRVILQTGRVRLCAGESAELVPLLRALGSIASEAVASMLPPQDGVYGMYDLAMAVLGNPGIGIGARQQALEVVISLATEHLELLLVPPPQGLTEAVAFPVPAASTSEWCMACLRLWLWRDVR
jgi:hypothetical protein